MRKIIALFSVMVLLCCSAYAKWDTGGGGNAKDVKVDTALFTTNLSSTDNTVQKSLDTLDDLSISPAGSDTQVQFNDGGSTFGGDAGMVYNKTTNLLTMTDGSLKVTDSTNANYTATLDADDAEIEMNPGSAISTFIWNESNVDVDYRFEGDGSHANLLLMDGGTGQVAVGGGYAGATYQAIFTLNQNSKAIDWYHDNSSGWYEHQTDGSRYWYNNGGRVQANFDSFSTSLAEPSTLRLRLSNNATVGTKTASVGGQIIGRLGFQGVDSGTNFDYGAYIDGIQDGTAGTTVPMKLEMAVYSSTAIKNKMTLENSCVTIGIDNASGSVNTPGAIRLWSDGDSASHVTIQAATCTTTQTYRWPTADGTNGKALVTNGNGYLTWGSAEATPSGTYTSIQFNDSGTMGGDAGLLYNKTTDKLITGSIDISKSTVYYVPIDGDIQTYIDALPAGGGVLVLAYGEYTITSPLNISKPVTIIGQGRSRTFITVNSASITGFNITYSYVTIKGLSIRTMQDGCVGITVDGSGGTTPLQDIQIFDVNIYYGGSATSALGEGCLLVKDSSFWVDNCEFEINASDASTADFYCIKVINSSNTDPFSGWGRIYHSFLDIITVNTTGNACVIQETNSGTPTYSLQMSLVDSWVYCQNNNVSGGCYAVSVDGSNCYIGTDRSYLGVTGVSSTKFELAATGTSTAHLESSSLASGLKTGAVTTPNTYLYGTSISISESDTTTGYYTKFIGSDQTGNITYHLPETDGTNGQALVTNGAGYLSFSTVGGSGGQDTVEVKTDTYNVTTSDKGKVLCMNTDTAETFVLPSVAAGDIGTYFTFIRSNMGRVAVTASDSDVILDSSAAGEIYNNTESYATITLVLATETQWLTKGGYGSWSTN